MTPPDIFFSPALSVAIRILAAALLIVAGVLSFISAKKTLPGESPASAINN